jgi:DNA-binding transcriptional MerR regulator
MASSESTRALTSGQLARETGVSPDTIRHYERLGLLRKAVRSEGGYRLFTVDSVRRVEMIRSAVSAGFSLAELGAVFAERDAEGAPCRAVARLGAAKVEALDGQIAQLIRLREWLAGTVAAWDERLKALPDGSRGHLLESLPKPNELSALLSEGNPDENVSHSRSALSTVDGTGAKRKRH